MGSETLLRDRIRTRSRALGVTEAGHGSDARCTTLTVRVAKGSYLSSLYCFGRTRGTTKPVPRPFSWYEWKVPRSTEPMASEFGFGVLVYVVLCTQGRLLLPRGLLFIGTRTSIIGLSPAGALLFTLKLLNALSKASPSTPCKTKILRMSFSSVIGAR